MRNPLARLVQRTPASPSLRERLAIARDRLTAAKHKAGQVATPAPTVDRAALVNYATFLALERRQVCAELYPHRGRRADQFVLALNEAWSFFNVSRGSPDLRKDLAPASTRAVQVLDAVGIDWRKDAAKDRGADYDRDTGARPALPYAWPAPDAALLEALDDLHRLEAAILALGKDRPESARDLDDVPGYYALEAARNDAVARLTKERSESLTGLQVKARALLTDDMNSSYSEGRDGLIDSLCHDLLGTDQPAVEPLPDPIFAAIAESRRLMRVWDEVNDRRLPPASTPSQEWFDASAAFHAHVDATLLKTVPQTAQGCLALARYAAEHRETQGFVLDEEDPHQLRVLALIARSPLL